MSPTEATQEEMSPRRKLIRDAAVTLFDERGYHGTRMRDIGSSLGMRAPSLYNHVASKQELLQEIMFDFTRSMISEHELAASSSGDAIDRLRRAMEAHVRHCARFRPETRIATHEVPSLEEPARAELLELRTDFSHHWVELIEQGVAEGHFSVDRTQLAAYTLIHMGVGVALWTRPLPLSESELAYSLAEMALRSVGVQDAEAASPAASAESTPVSK
jgi:AcrR family transcriptional regulator